MTISIEKLNESISEAKRFLSFAQAAKKRLSDNKFASYGCKETGAVKRSSMDLSRLLSGLRR